MLKSLVRRYTKQTLNEAKGPITVVSGEKKRITFIECNNDLNSMIDVAKVADLVLLMIDGSYGFEMVCSHSLLHPCYDVKSNLNGIMARNDHRKRSNSSMSSNPMDSQKSSVSSPTLTSSKRRPPSVPPRKHSKSVSGQKSTKARNYSTSRASLTDDTLIPKSLTCLVSSE